MLLYATFLALTLCLRALPCAYVPYPVRALRASLRALHEHEVHVSARTSKKVLPLARTATPPVKGLGKGEVRATPVPYVL